MLDEIGGFDEDFFAYGDDAELGLRARIAGLAVPLRAGRRGAAPPRRHAGARLGAAAGTDRAQPRAAGRQAVSLAAAVAERAVLPGAHLAAGVRCLARGLRRRGAFPGAGG